MTRPATLYRITLRGHLDLAWADGLDGFSIEHLDNGQSLLTGPVSDQAALHGVLRRIRDLGMPLVSVSSVAGPAPRGASSTSARMKAIVYESYGSADVLHLADTARPVPGPGQVLVQVGAAALNQADVSLMRGKPLFLRPRAGGLFRPRRKILGSDVAGIVSEIGTGVTRFTPGERVFGDLSESGRGGFAEYVVAPESMLAPVPDGVPLSDAAAVPMAAGTALQALEHFGVLEPGRRVAIDGASGGVGTFAIQIAKAWDAHVTAVCSSAKMDVARAAGADCVIDSNTDFTRGRHRFDLIHLAYGRHRLEAYLRVLDPNGRLVMTGGGGPLMMQVLRGGRRRRRSPGPRVHFLVMKPTAETLSTIGGLLAGGELSPVIDRKGTLRDIPDLVRHLESRRARGKLVVEIDPEPATSLSSTRSSA